VPHFYDRVYNDVIDTMADCASDSPVSTPKIRRQPMIEAKVLRAEFERQHSGRNVKQHGPRGTYVSSPTASLWNQHLCTAKWLTSDDGFKQVTDFRATMASNTGDKSDEY
jgi:hypothetical protein